MSRRSTNGGAADETGRMVSAAFPAAAGVNLGDDEAAEGSHLQPAVEQLARHFIKKGRKSSALLIFALSVLFGGGGYFAMQAAVDRHTEELEQLDSEVDLHDAKPAHDGAASKSEVGALEDKVQQLDKSVGNLGIKIDERSKAQEKQYESINRELRIIRLRRRDP